MLSIITCHNSVLSLDGSVFNSRQIKIIIATILAFFRSFIVVIASTNVFTAMSPVTSFVMRMVVSISSAVTMMTPKIYSKITLFSCTRVIFLWLLNKEIIKVKSVSSPAIFLWGLNKWSLSDAKWVIFQLYHGWEKLFFDEMMIMPHHVNEDFYIVKTQWYNRHVVPLLTYYPQSKSNQSFLLLLSVASLSGEAAKTNITSSCSELKLWVWTLFMAKRTQYNIMW